MVSTGRLCGGPRACGVHRTLCGCFLCCGCQSLLCVISFILILLPFDWLSVFSFNLIQPGKQGETISGGRKRVQGGNVETQASAAPQGNGRRRARLELEGVTDQPAATRKRAEEARRPEWTMSSTVRDILQEGGTGMTNMKLNDFLWDYVGGGAAVDEDHNLTVEVFFHKPDDYVQDQQPFDEIHNLTEYQGLEGRGILLEATTKLEGEGVFILKEWRNLGRRFTVTLLAREKLDKAFTQVLEEKMVEEKGRA
ncbi:retrotransposon hot spot (RHS) protein [Trypanosoma cruzi]|nr:retrotransposon hot spot (RHS) protein [Trypanosoma cruzi]